MENLYKYLRFVSAVTLPFLCFAFSAGTPACAEEQRNVTGNSSAFELNAAIMEIDLDNAYLVVAEEKLSLSHTTQQGKKEWKTEVLDTKGQKITIESLRQKDRVMVEGTKTPSGIMNAHKITLLADEEALGKTETHSSSKQTSSPIKLQDGVWKN